MKIPKSVRVGGIKVKVIWCDMDDKWGDFNQDKREIRLSRQLNKKPKDTLLTLVHEMAHASFRLTGLSEVMGDETEEAVVRNIEQIFIPAIRKILVDGQ